MTDLAATTRPVRTPDGDAAEHLTTGWDHAVALTDTMHRRFLHHLAATNAAFVGAGGGRVEDHDGWRLADSGRPGGYWNAAVVSAPPDDWHDLARRITAETRGGHGDLWVWSPGPTPDLTVHGWRLSGHPPLLVRPPVETMPLPPGRRGEPAVVEVRTPHELRAWEEVAVRAYPLDVPAGGLPGAVAPAGVLEDPRVRCFASTGAGTDGFAAVAALVTAHGIASLAFGATLPAARGAGHWEALARARLLAAPSAWFAGVFSDMSRPLAEHLGFVPVLRLTLWAIPRTAGDGT